MSTWRGPYDQSRRPVLSHGARTPDWKAFHTTEQERRDWAPGYEPPKPRSPLLDHRSEPHPLLSYLMDEALIRIMLVSDGAVAALKQRTTGSKAGTIAPKSELAKIVHGLDLRFEACKTHRRRLEAIKDAQDMGDRLRYAPDRSKVRGTREWREAIITDPRSCRVLGSVYDVNASTISRIKKKGFG